MDEGWTWAAIGAVIAGLFTIGAQRLRGQTDETVAVMGQWKELLDAHKASAEVEIKALKERVTLLETELAGVRDQSSKDMAELRKSHSAEIEEMRQKHRAEMREMRDLNEGLQRMIAQTSKSTAVLMDDKGITGSLRRAYRDPPGDK